MPSDDLTAETLRDDVERLLELWEETIERREDEGRHVNAQVMGRCRGELERVLEEHDE